MAELRTLLENLRRGETPALDVAAVDELVGWLLGKGDPEPDLPRPEHDPVLQQMVFYRLDATLFSAGELRLGPAGLGPEEPAKLRKTRFRRLAGAFHPDRHPDLADWLTERSQAVLRAYGRFKHGAEPDLPTRSPAAPYPGYPPPRPPRRGPFRGTRLQLRTAAESLRRRFGNDRLLPHKLIGGLALLALLPVLNLLLVPKPDRFDAIGDSAGGAASYNRPGESADGAASYSRPGESAGGAASYNRPGESAGGAASYNRPGESAGGAASESGPGVSEGGAASESGSGVSAGGAAAESEPGADVDSALLAAAREAMRLGESEYTHLPSVDEQLAAMGLDTDTERLYRRIRASAESAPAGPAAADRSSTRSAPAPSSPAQPVTATEAPGGEPVDAGADVGADSIGDAGVEPASPMRDPTDSAPAGAVTRSGSPGTSSTAPRAAVSGPLPEDLALVAADSIGAADVESESPMVSSIESAPTDSASTDAIASTGSSVESEIEPAIRPAQSPATAFAPPQATEPRPLPELEASELTLGLLSSQPQGTVLRAYVSAIESGDLVALLTQFDRQARHGVLRGSEPIARHYQALFASHAPRRVALRVLRARQNGARWEIEVELLIEGLQSGQLVAAREGRASFTLAGNPLRIHRLEF